MNSTYLKGGVSIAEILLGLAGIVISAYYLLQFQFCNPNAELCKPLTMLPVVVLLVPGVFAFGAGIVSVSMKQLTFWKVQLTMLFVLCLYYILLIVSVYMLKG